ncbi:MAG: hypothetical protein COV07_00560 [Candidatus Vogelbacteria bacterium CG10_big_fil_rev_8_21_14_0_10_45_14]|uniref:Uncharacterized protein n=1 Tax=Candidatus Vogelbacteria bacterium CG10_big_fil_rev_8_21_14_0_10_45_14 TaxID=1975042 RepID=A0A2H0RL08_9BACT|nr:MAG: hypothetical protein COV07_00560 [Candidatus Vogelbacteria bacterium CG10_big_fil_rev_8_21_14_0_10_45_14]
MLYFIGETWVKLLIEVFRTAWLWLPPVLCIAFYNLLYEWLQMRWRFIFFDRTILEIKLPEEITRSPKAMEFVLGALHITTSGQTYDKWHDGQVRGWQSLELVSYGGDIHFYITVRDKFAKHVESAIYAHYPEVEISEVDDYTAKLPYEMPGSDWSLWGCLWKMKKEEPKDAGRSINTYVDLGLDKESKEEFKVDPMIPLLEHLGQIGPNEQIWIQIVLRAVKSGDWIKPVEEFVKTLTFRDQEPEPGVFINFARQTMTKSESAFVEGIERKMFSQCFETGIRAIYFSKVGHFNKLHVLPFLGIWKPVSGEGQGIDFAISTTYDQPWEDPTGMRSKNLRDKFWREYRWRGWHYDPFKRRPAIMSTEELATLYHFPGSVAKTPGLQRIRSKKSEPPMNLPT